MPDNKQPPWWEQREGESLQDYIKRVGVTVNSAREKVAVDTMNTANAIGNFPGKVAKGAGAYPGIAQNTAKILGKGADAIVSGARAYPGIAQNMVKIATRKRPGTGGAAGGSGGGTARRIPSPVRPATKPIIKGTKSTVRKIK